MKGVLRSALQQSGFARILTDSSLKFLPCLAGTFVNSSAKDFPSCEICPPGNHIDLNSGRAKRERKSPRRVARESVSSTLFTRLLKGKRKFSTTLKANYSFKFDESARESTRSAENAREFHAKRKREFELFSAFVLV